MTRKIGYARVSTKDQNLDMQIDALQKEGCDLIFQEYASGKDRNRKELKKALDALHEGDTLVFWKIDRLSRDANHTSNIVYNLRKRNIKLKGIIDNVTHETAMGRHIISTFASFGEMEVEDRSNRTKAGLEAARRRGTKLGRPKRSPLKVMTYHQLSMNTNLSKSEIALQMGVHRSTVYRYLEVHNAS